MTDSATPMVVPEPEPPKLVTVLGPIDVSAPSLAGTQEQVLFHEHILSDQSHLCTPGCCDEIITMTSLAKYRLHPFANATNARLDSAADQFRSLLVFIAALCLLWKFRELQHAHDAGVRVAVDTTHSSMGRNPPGTKLKIEKREEQIFKTFVRKSGLAKLAKSLGMCLVMGATTSTSAVAHLQEKNIGTRTDMDLVEAGVDMVSHNTENYLMSHIV